MIEDAVAALADHGADGAEARRSAHARLPQRKAGDCPVGIDSVALTRAGSRIGKVVVSVGSVEPVAITWLSLVAWFAS